MKRNTPKQSRAMFAVAAVALAMVNPLNAGLFFWDNVGADNLFSNTLNWDPDGNPGGSDLVVHNNSALPAITVNADWTVDSLRLSDGGAVSQESGTLSIAGGGDQGLWVGEFGNAVCTYTLNAGSIILNDDANAFDVGRANGSYGIFNMNGGGVTNYSTADAFFVGRWGGAFGRFNMTAGVVQGPTSDTHIGLDGAAEWYQSGGTFNAGGIQIGRFASPFATVELSGTAAWNSSGLVLLADGHGVFDPRNSGPVDLRILGPSVTFSSQGLVIMKEGNLTFDGQGTGVSKLNLNGGIFLLTDGELFLNSLPTPTSVGQTVVLIENIGSYTGADTQFDNAADGAAYGDESGLHWQLKYQGTNIVLVAAAGCTAPTISVDPASKQVVLNSELTLSISAGGTSLNYEWRLDGTAIPGASFNPYTIPSAGSGDAGNYTVVITNTCGAVTSKVAVVEVVAPGTVYFWDNGSGDGLFDTAANWNPDATTYGQPYVSDLAVIPGGQGIAVIKTNASVDTLRISDGGGVVHTNGLLTIANGVAPDNGLWVGEFNNATYTLDGGAIHIKDPNDGFMVGRSGNADATFTLVSGFVTNVVGDTHIGLDGIAVWNQSGGLFRGAGVQIGRFASPSAAVNLSGNAAWDVGLVLMADGHGVFTPRNAGPVDLRITGPNVAFKSTGLVMFDEGTITFDGTGGGISPMDLGNGQFLLTNGKLFLENLPTTATSAQEIVLLENIGARTGADTQFDNAPAGTVYGGLWQIDYRTDSIVLFALPTSIQITDFDVVGSTATLKFSAGAADSAESFVIQGSTTVNGTYTGVAATISSLGAGSFEATIPVSGSSMFFQVAKP